VSPEGPEPSANGYEIAASISVRLWPSNTASGASKYRPQHEAVPDQLQPQPPARKRLKIVRTGPAQDAGVVEEAAEENEDEPEGDREADQECAGPSVDVQPA
jgi:hypothetical protein